MDSILSEQVHVHTATSITVRNYVYTYATSIQWNLYIKDTLLWTNILVLNKEGVLFSEVEDRYTESIVIWGRKSCPFYGFFCIIYVLNSEVPLYIVVSIIHVFTNVTIC